VPSQPRPLAMQRRPPSRTRRAVSPLAVPPPPISRESQKANRHGGHGGDGIIVIRAFQSFGI
jgi:hypothetical protein